MADGFVDTAILVDIIRGHAPAMQWMEANLSAKLGIVPTVWMELVVGTRDKRSQAIAVALLSSFELVYPTQSEIEWAIEQLEKYHLSHNVGMNDCLIAAPAFRLRLPLYTQNVKHFTPLLGALAIKPY